MLRRAIPIAAALALVITACGDDEESSPSEATETAEATESAEATEPASATSAEADAESETDTAAFPVTIEHKYGETTIDAEPQRVVSVGFNDQDFLLALGVTPVGVRDWYGDQPYATWPWAQDELGDAQPEVIPAAEINFEQIAALDPDLIVGISSGMTETEYQTLSAIAPTITQSADYIDYGLPWDLATEVLGRATGRSEEAAAVIEHVKGLFTSVREEHPEFEGATAAVTYVHEGLPGSYASEDGRARLLSELGFVTPPTFDELAGDAFWFTVSAEEIQKLDADVMIWLVSSDLDLPAVAEIPTRPSLKAYAEGREVVADAMLGGAFSFGSPLSMEYLLEKLVPELALAVDGDPATVVPSAAGLLEGAAPSNDVSGEASGSFDTDEQAAADAWSTVFDSGVDFATKASLLEDADALKATIENYSTVGSTMGGISLVPTAVSIDGASATVTYDVMFGDNAAYQDLTGTIDKTDGGWVVPRSEFCSFMASARNACPA